MITCLELTDKHRSLTNREYLSLHSTLSLDRIEALVQMEDAIRGPQGALNYMDEASGCFPDEDALQDTISNLETLHNELRVTSEDDLRLIKDDFQCDLYSVIEGLRDLQTTITNDTRCGLEALSSAKEATYQLDRTPISG